MELPKVSNGISGSQSSQPCPPDNGPFGRDTTEPIAIVGFSFKFPGGCETDDSFWKALLEKRNTATEIPPDRLNGPAFYHPELHRRGTIPFRGGHFLTTDIAEFDAPFFSISDSEAASLDPQQRGLLETTFRALENAGQVVSRAVGSKTSVFTGCFTNDWQQLSLKDAEQCTDHAGVGFEASILANRLSWFFNFKGTCFNVDSACSSSLVSLDLACRSLASGDADMSIAAGCNLIFYPDVMHALSNLGLLSPDSRCYSFDSRANGYARGEGFGVVVLKRLSDAIKHGDNIRAVIRSTGSNQDGFTPGITQPSGKAQSELIRDTYARAGVSLERTMFFEAHGTGTAVGDPIEASAVGDVFRHTRRPDQPLYVGAVKSNIGHLEGASGIAGVIKTVLALEKGVIPPNTNFLNVNPQIDTEFLRIKFPLQPTIWPSSGLRRASINSFGFGGTNAHAIIDDAFHYLQEHGLVGNHTTVEHAQGLEETSPNNEALADGVKHSTEPLLSNGVKDSTNDALTNRTRGKNEQAVSNAMKKSRSHGRTDSMNDSYFEQTVAPPSLLVFSAMDEDTLNGQIRAYKTFLQNIPTSLASSRSFLHDLAYTLNSRRKAFPWRTAAIIRTMDELANLDSQLPHSQRSVSEPSLCLVFTGQGAQYAGDKLQCLEKFEIFAKSLLEAEDYLQELGCAWKLREELFKPAKFSKINDAEYSQPISTAVQVALVNLLRSFNIYPKVVVGHSSGEIAAAYSIGAISAQSAWKLAYFRGLHSALLLASGDSRGAMMAVSLSEEDVGPYIDRVVDRTGVSMLTVACINSPRNVTVSGHRDHINILERMLIDGGISARKLNVDMAYHSPFMNAVAQRYAESITLLDKGTSPPHSIPMISTVTGKWVKEGTLRMTQYWVDNMISPVKFSTAIEGLTFQPMRKIWDKLDCSHRNHSKVTFLLEVGFHSALRVALRQILSDTTSNSKISYESTLVRGKPCLDSLFNSLAQIYCHGYPVDLNAVNILGQKGLGNPKLLSNLPEYRFNHSRRYWEEGRVSKRLRLHDRQKLDLLGKPSPDWNEIEAKWRNFLRVSEMPWLEEHKINGAVIYPAAGMLVMAIEAANQMTYPGRKVDGFELKDVRFLSALNIAPGPNGVETHVYLRQIPSSETPWAEFRVCSFGMDEWRENCRGFIRVQYQQAMSEAVNAGRKETFEELKTCRQRDESFSGLGQENLDHGVLYETLRRSGYDYGPAFRLLRNGIFNSDDEGRADVKIYEWPINAFPQPHIIHPCTLDGILHLTVATYAQGGRVEIPTAVPSSIRKLWVANRGLSYPEAQSVRATTYMTDRDDRGTEFNVSVLDASRSEVLLQSEGMRATIVAEMSTSSSRNRNQSDEKQVCYVIDSKPDVTLLNRRELSDYCARVRVMDHPEPVQFYEDLTFALLAFLTDAVKDHLGDMMDSSDVSPHLSKYLEWARFQLGRYQKGTLPYTKPEWARLLEDEDFVERKCCEVEATSDLGRVYITAGRQLKSILRGETDSLEFLFKPNLLQDFYGEINSSRACFTEFAHFLDAVGHKNPRLKILEVGAGTGSTTENVLSTLSGNGDRMAHNPRYSSYHYTDISPSFFEAAQVKFARYPRMEFGTLNIELDPSIQGFECGTFDLVVVASGVLHATSNIDTTVGNVRKLLKPGGLLMLYEQTRPDILRTAFIMGLLPGWWLSSEADRRWGPTMTSASWEKALCKNGFLGIELELPDFLTPECQENSIIIAKATTTANNSVTTGGRTFLVAELDSDFQKSIVLRLKSTLSEDCRLVGFAEAAHIEEDMADSYFIFLVELERPILMDLSEDMYTALQSIVTTSKGVLWVTDGGGIVSKRPESGIANGLFRVLRNENPGRPFGTLALDLRSVVTDEQLAAISHLFHDIQQCSDPSMEDMEYVEINGLLEIPRVIQAPNLTENLFRGSLSHQSDKRYVKDHPHLKLVAGSIGFLDTLHFTEDDDFQRPLAPDEVEVEVRAIGLNFRDCLVALGRIPGSPFGYECAGIISRVGGSCGLSPGDRVALSSSGTLKTFARGKSSHALKINDGMSFAEAASIPVQFGTAWQAVHELARLQPGESILIHAGAGGTGQAAIQVAQYIGAIIYATVGSETKKNVLIEEYGIPEDCIFYSRDTSFAKGVMRMTKGRGVDVVLNSLAGESLIAGWECMAAHGRFIELGKKDILSNANLPMYSFRKNTSFMSFDCFAWQSERPEHARRCLEKVFELFAQNKFHPAWPLHVKSVANVEEAFRSMQDGKTAGKTVLEVSPETEVKTTLATQPSFYMDENSTYVIAGGFGGLGRHVARWLVDRGARYLLLLSRSGVRSETSRTFMEELKQRGIKVMAPACDVTDVRALRHVIERCSDQMPRIKGCIQGSMVLRDSLFDRMSYGNWRLGTNCKTVGSWNLHQLLPKGMEFFVLLSSASGVAGLRGQANYAAGNSYMDALARYRVSLGERAVSLDLGALTEDGLLAEDRDFLDRVLKYGALNGISRRYFNSILDHYCNPSLPLVDHPMQSQPIIGLGTGAEIDLDGMAISRQAIFRHLSEGPEVEFAAQKNKGGQEDWKALFSGSNSLADAAHVVSQTLIQKLRRTLSILHGEVDMYKPLAVYGVDSLLAVELRSWIAKEFLADVVMFEISGESSFSTLSVLVASRSKLEHPAWS